jgi:hypothetical protein
MDGNVQHSRLQDRAGHEYKVLMPKLFVDYGRRAWEVAGKRALRDHGSESCGHKFKATNGWNKAVAAAASKNGVHETGLMAITCFHGIGIRHVNLYGENERHSHGERLLEATHTDCPKAPRMRVCYWWLARRSSSSGRCCVTLSPPVVIRLDLGERRKLILAGSSLLNVRVRTFTSVGRRCWP